MQQTENYQLSLWNKEDRILMGLFREEEPAVNAPPEDRAKIAAKGRGSAVEFCRDGPQA